MAVIADSLFHFEAVDRYLCIGR